MFFKHQLYGIICILDDEGLIDSIKQYLSILSGPLIACINVSFLTLIPVPNILEQPQYWYEDHFFKSIPVVSMIGIQLLIHAEVWSNFSFQKKWQTYVLSLGLTYVAYVVAVTGYHFIWTYYLP